MRTLLLLTFLFGSLWAKDLKIKDMEASRQSKEPHIFAHKQLTSFFPQIPKVNVIDGLYCEQKTDLVVAGIEPLSFRRFYAHQGHRDTTFGHWRIHPECDFFFNFEFSKSLYSTYELFAATGMPDGSFYLFKKKQGQTFSLDPSELKGYCNFGDSAASHPLNTSITYQKKYTTKYRGSHYALEGSITTGDGSKRTFETEEHEWPSNKRFRYRNYRSYDQEWVYIEPFPPYQSPIKEERKPNGNILVYEYINYWEIISIPGSLRTPSCSLLKSITAYNATKTQVLGSIQLSYQDLYNTAKNTIKNITIAGSDGRKSILNQTYRFLSKKDVTGGDVVLASRQTPSEPTQYYNYHWAKFKDYYSSPPFLNIIYEKNGRDFHTEYDPHTQKVAKQHARVGPDNEYYPIATYTYGSDYTIVHNGEDQQTVYRFNKDKRITSTEYYEGQRIIRKDCNQWDPSTGNLLCTTIIDGSGKILHMRELQYDQNQNVICVRLGDGVNKDVIKRTFSDDGFNLKLSESDRSGKWTYYTYVPNSCLLTSEIVYVDNQICKRAFHTYDDELQAVRVKSIIDDGQTLDPDDLSGVTYRKIIEIKPKRTLPCVGLTEELREKTINQKGNEVLLKKVRYGYHPSGKIKREDHFDANNNWCYSISNTYDAKERLVATTDALGYCTTFAYDENNNLISKQIEEMGLYQEWEYDNVNRPVKEHLYRADGTILTTQKKYDKCSRLISSIDASGFETCYCYDVLDRLTTTIHPDGSVEHKKYDALGNIIEQRDANLGITCREYNFRNQPTAIYHANGSQEYFTYNPGSGTCATHIDANGCKRIYQYDHWDNLLSTKIEAGATTSATYSAFCKLSTTDALGVPTYFIYDFAGRLIQKEHGDCVLFYEYDAMGRIAFQRAGETLTTSIFDEKNQLIETVKAPLCEKGCYFKRYQYDAAGNQTAVITCGGITHTKYNSQNQPIEVTDPEGNITTIAYSYTDGFCKTTTDAKGVKTIELHDCRGRLATTLVQDNQGSILQKRERKYDGMGNQTYAIEHIYHQGNFVDKVETRWIYNSCGQLLTLIEAESKTTHYLYDDVGRLSVTTKPDGSLLQRKYDHLGRLSYYVGKGFCYRYCYDAKDQIVRVTDECTNSTTIRNYDLYGNVVQEKLASGLEICNQYDPYGRRTALSLPDGSQATYSYRGPYLHKVARDGLEHIYSSRNLAGHPTAISFCNGDEAIITWDASLRCQTFTCDKYRSGYKYDVLGLLVEQRYVDALGPNLCTYSYDELKQLQRENEHSYRYDSLYNRIAKDSIAYDVNGLCQVTHDGENSYTYDACGNLLSDGHCSYEYDGLDRLVAVIRDGLRTTYAYDAFNRRIAKNEDLFIWDGKKEIGVWRGDKIVQLRVLAEGLGAEIGASVLMELDGQSYIPLHDHQGSLVTLVNLEDDSVEAYRYTAFGERVAGVGISPWQFSSKRLDEETGFVYFGRRYYSPTLGRWITADPLGFADGPNLYAYVGNSPLVYLDLHGLYSWHSTWNGLKDFGRGVGLQVRDMAFGVGHAFRGMGEWMLADSMYEMGHRSLFSQKSASAYSGWQNIGSSLYHHPGSTVGGMFAPGLMQAWQSPGSAEAWGRAAVDVALLGGSVLGLAKSTRLGGVAKSNTSLARTSNIAAVAPRAFVSRGAENINAAVSLRRKLSQRRDAPLHSSYVRNLSDNRVRFYEKEVFSSTQGPTRGSSYVVEVNLRTNNTRAWMECYDHSGNVNRIHPKQINGQELHAQHYPPIAKELIYFE